MAGIHNSTISDLCQNLTSIQCISNTLTTLGHTGIRYRVVSYALSPLIWSKDLAKKFLRLILPFSTLRKKKQVTSQMSTTLSVGEQAKEHNLGWALISALRHRHTRESWPHKCNFMNTITSDTAQASFGPIPPPCSTFIINSTGTYTTDVTLLARAIVWDALTNYEHWSGHPKCLTQRLHARQPCTVGTTSGRKETRWVPHFLW